jgi:G3E family GTPase
MGARLHLITGFLGSGKTTAVRHLLRALPPNTRSAVVVNDFGEAEIDLALLGEGGAVRAISGSCACCTAPDGFVAAVGSLLDGGAERIFVEPTGLARPADLVDTLRRAPYADRLALGPLIVLVDPHALAAGSIPADVLAQLGMGDVIAANRVDLASEAELERFRAWAAALDPQPVRLYEVAHGQLPLDALDWPAGAGPRSAPAGTRYHLHDVGRHPVQSWSWPPDAVLSRAAVRAALGAGGIVRAKGLLRTDEGWIELQRAGAALHEASTAWRRDSRLDAFGADPAALTVLAEALDAAMLDPSASDARGTTLELGEAGRRVDRAWLGALPDQVPDVGALIPGRAGAAVPLREVLRGAGIDIEGGRSLVVVARDGFVTPPTPASELLDGLIVHSLGGGALPEPQGGPFRLLVPGRKDACGNVKGVVRITLR